MIRNIDNLGRLVIPKEIRSELNLKNGDAVNIKLEDNKIIITNPNLNNPYERIEELENLILGLNHSEPILTKNQIFLLHEIVNKHSV